MLNILLFSIFRDQDERETILFGVFAFIITLFLILDLGLFHKQAQRISTRSALYQSIFWVSISTLYGVLIYLYGPYQHEVNGVQQDLGGTDAAVLYFSAYLTEYALSVDNIFVILLILKYFQVNDAYHHRILFWGIIGAVIFRALFIFLGAFLISKFHWILYIFGVFLILIPVYGSILKTAMRRSSLKRIRS